MNTIADPDWNFLKVQYTPWSSAVTGEPVKFGMAQVPQACVLLAKEVININC